MLRMVRRLKKDKQLDLHEAGRKDVRMVRERHSDTIKKGRGEGRDCVANSTSYKVNFILFFLFLAVQWKKNSSIQITKCFRLGLRQFSDLPAL